MNIAICDDCESDALLARDIIKKSLKNIDVIADVICYYQTNFTLSTTVSH